jgi:hypothetical protein
MHRRRFLGLATAACGCAVARRLFAAVPEDDAAPYADPYYRTNRDRFLADFDKTNSGALQYLTRTYDAALARDVTESARGLFAGLLPGLPPTGGDANWVTKFLPISGWYLAYCRAMRPLGLGPGDAGRMIYDLETTDFQQNAERYAAAGQAMFTSGALQKTREWAQWTQQRDYPANWVAEFVPGDGATFDFGYDYTRCGLFEYLKAQGEPELAAYVCLTDFPRSRAEDSGLVRSGTLAMGASRCDFRYRQGRPVTQDWDTEIGKIGRRPAE